MLPLHGKIDCRECFQEGSTIAYPHEEWRMINDPGAWGSNTPKYLVLGFSKGATQAGIYEAGRFDDIAFAGMRSRLAEALRTMGILGNSEEIETKISDPSSDIAFGSLIRCSVSRIDDKASSKAKKTIYGCTGPLISKSFKEIPEIINHCSNKFLCGLPDSVRCVFFLGNTTSYVKHCQNLLSELFSQDYEQINSMGVFADKKGWIHIAHPSGLNGHFNAWICNSLGPGLKRIEAQNALSYIENKHSASCETEQCYVKSIARLSNN